MDDPHVRVEYAFHFVVFAANDAKIGHLLERQNLGEESRLPVAIRYGKGSTSPGRRSRSLPDNASASTRVPAAKEALGRSAIPPIAAPPGRAETWVDRQ